MDDPIPHSNHVFDLLLEVRDEFREYKHKTKYLSEVYRSTSRCVGPDGNRDTGGTPPSGRCVGRGFTIAPAL